MQGKLFLISMPIGNIKDITLRALSVLKEVDLIICEEFKTGISFLKKYEIEKRVLQINEHNEKEESLEIIKILKEGKNIGLISDHGTPLLEDPGSYLVKLAIKEKINITAIPGASSILPALILSGFNLKKYTYYGLLPVKKEERRQELQKLRNKNETIIILDTPYRLHSLLADIKDILGHGREISLATNLTMENEIIFRGTVSEVITELNKRNIKKTEFVLIISGNFQKVPSHKRNGIYRKL